MAQQEPIGFLGLGDLGRPVAANLLDAGIDLTVYNRTSSRTEQLAARGAKVALRPRDAIVQSGGVVLSLLWDAQSVEDVVRSEGFLDQLGPGGLHVSMSTIAPDAARSIAVLHEQAGATMISAPIFGRPEAAVAKTLLIAASGAFGSKQRVQPILKAAGAKDIVDFGDDVGAALAVKLAGNFLIISAAAALIEALAMASAQGVDRAKLADMLTTTLFPVPIYRNYSRMIVDGQLPVIDSPIAGKDVSLFADVSQQAGLAAPVARALLSGRSAN